MVAARICKNIGSPVVSASANCAANHLHRPPNEQRPQEAPRRLPSWLCLAVLTAQTRSGRAFVALSREWQDKDVQCAVQQGQLGVPLYMMLNLQPMLFAVFAAHAYVVRETGVLASVELLADRIGCDRSLNHIRQWPLPALKTPAVESILVTSWLDCLLLRLSTSYRVRSVTQWCSIMHVSVTSDWCNGPHKQPFAHFASSATFLCQLHKLMQMLFSTPSCLKFLKTFSSSR